MDGNIPDKFRTRTLIEGKEVLTLLEPDSIGYGSDGYRIYFIHSSDDVLGHTIEKADHILAIETSPMGLKSIADSIYKALDTILGTRVSIIQEPDEFDEDLN